MFDKTKKEYPETISPIDREETTGDKFFWLMEYNPFCDGE